MASKKLRDRLNIYKENREIFNKIRDSDGDLGGLSTTDLFLYAMMVGFYILKKRESIVSNEGYVLEKYLTSDNWNIINSVAALEEKSLNVIMDKDKTFTIAEEYANAGIHKLNDWYYENEYDFIERIEEYLIEEYENQGIGEEEQG